MSVIVKGGGGKPEEEKIVTAGTSVIEVNPSSGKVMKKVTINPTPSQEKTIEDPSETTIIIPDEGKLLSKVTINIFNPSLVTWAGGTDEEIVAMVAAADRGEINLSDYWAVGDTRTVQLSAMDATGVGESHAEQNVELVLMHAGGYELADSKTCNFVVGQKDSLAEGGYMNSTNTNLDSWEGSARRVWCNNEYKNAMPVSLLPIFKQFKTITAQEHNGTTLKTSLDYFALPAEREVFGAGYGYDGKGYANNTEAACEGIFQFDYYKTDSNRIKKLGKTGSANEWWERSPFHNISSGFCFVSSVGAARNGGAKFSFGLAPFGCI